MTLSFAALFDSLPLDIAESLAWRGEGHCVGMSQAVFFPGRGQRGADAANVAKIACMGCPVRRACLVDALERKDRHGVRTRRICRNHHNAFGTIDGPGGADTPPALVRTCMEVRTMPDATCSIDDCANNAFARSWCKAHYLRWYRHGDPLKTGDRNKPNFHNRRPIAGRFWSKVDFSNPDGCWPWKGSMRHAYGEVWINGQKEYAHRVAFKLVYGYEPEAVCHHCDNPPCCRPDHLFGGTQVDNCHDMWAKGRGSLPPLRTGR